MITKEQLEAAQEVFEKWFCEDLGLDLSDSESSRIIEKILVAAEAKKLNESKREELSEAFSKELMTGNANVDRLISVVEKVLFATVK